MEDISLVMLAAGNSTRFNCAVKKQFIRIGSEPLWLYSTKRLASFYPFKKVVVASSNASYMKKFNPEYEFVNGSNSRQNSLKNALSKVDSEFVMVSDAARVNISSNLVTNLIKNIKNADCISPALGVSDTVVYQNKTINRDEILRIQTPQLSKTALLKKALETKLEFSDDTSAMKHCGFSVCFIEGEESARKITTKQDLEFLNLKPASKHTLIGTGFDVHEFQDFDKKLVLGGIHIPNHKGLKAHSDGDVLIHALVDSLLGAAALGDIGEHFSDQDQKYKNIQSTILLQKSIELVRQYGFEIINIDLTLIAQSPKISPYKDEITQNLATILNIKPYQINLKASTTEHLGFIGRKEGMAALSSASLGYFDWMEN